MRSWLSPPNQSSPCRVTYTELAAWILLPVRSVAVTTSSTSPGSDSVVSHNNNPRLSLLPEHTLPRSLTVVWLS